MTFMASRLRSLKPPATASSSARVKPNTTNNSETLRQIILEATGEVTAGAVRSTDNRQWIILVVNLDPCPHKGPWLSCLRCIGQIGCSGAARLRNDTVPSFKWG